MRTARNLQILLILTTMVPFFAGCGEKLPSGMPRPVPCEIVVIQEGEPLEGAVVRLVPVDGTPWDAVGRTDASGRTSTYALDRYKGAVPGKYKVVVSKTEQGGQTEPLSSEEYQRLQMQGQDMSVLSFNLVAEQYGEVEQTPLEIEVAKGTPTHTLDVGKAVRIVIKR